MAFNNFTFRSNHSILIWGIDLSLAFYVFLILLINLLCGLIMFAFNHFLEKVGYHK